MVFAKSSSTIVMDVESGRVLYSHQAEEKRLIASITKIMTCIVVLENVKDLDQEVLIGDEVLSSYGTNIYIEPGEKIKVIDLLYGLMLRSGNDAALSLATFTSGSEEVFVQMMNDKAKSIGMKDTVFSNSHGLDEETKNYSTAYDMALLSSYAYQNKIYQKIISTKKYQTKSSLKSYVWYNRVSLLSTYLECIGGKNGYTPNAGKTLVSLAKKDNLILTIVSLNDSDLYHHHRMLYEEYFQTYKKYQIVDQKKFFIHPSLMNGRDVYIKDSFSYPLREDELSKISTIVSIYSKKNQHKVGVVTIRFNKKVLKEIPVYEKKQKIKDRQTIFHWFFHLFV